MTGIVGSSLKARSETRSAVKGGMLGHEHCSAFISLTAQHVHLRTAFPANARLSGLFPHFIPTQVAVVAKRLRQHTNGLIVEPISYWRHILNASDRPPVLQL